MFLEKVKNKLNKNKTSFIGEDTAFQAAVLIPLVQVEGEWHILFEVRSFNMRTQPGDISFPGGKIDPSDASPLAAALRETEEELGVDPNTVTVIQELSPYIASPTFVIYPFVAVIDNTEIIPDYNKDEVEEVFTIPVDWLLNYEPEMHLVSLNHKPAPDFPFEKIINGADYQWGTRAIEEWFYDYEQYTIWGLTARILKFFLETIK